MEITFDLVRIGGIRKNKISETILKQNIDFIRDSIRTLLKDMHSKNNSVSMTMIIPSKGYNIKIALQDIKEEHIKKELRDNFSEFIYKADYSIVLDNCHNKIF